MTDAAAPRSRKTWDLVLTIVLLVGALLFAVGFSYLAILLVFASDSCSASCDSGQLGFGVAFGFVSPYVALLLAIAGSIILLVKKRVAFWVPIAGTLLGLGGLAIGAALVLSSTGH